jgi:Xaa-Pro aminopeptidase
MNSQTQKSRLKGIRDRISHLKADCLIVTKPANVTCVTGFMGDDSWAIVLPRRVVLVTDSRYTEQAALECRLCSIIVCKDAMTRAIAGLMRNLRGIKTAAVEKSTSIADFEGLKKHLPCRLRPAGGIVESARRAKDTGEIAAIRAAAKIAGRAFEQVLRRLRQGLTENELAGILDFEIRKLGGRNSFDAIVAFGANASKPHHRPTSRKLGKNDAVLIDFGVRHNGYCCDITRCFAVGKPAGFFNKVYAAVNEARSTALKMVRAGVEIKRVDAAAKAVIRKYGLPVYGHGTGHGLGLEVHELPSVSAKSEGKLQAGDVITIEPAVYIPGRLGVRIEDDVLVTKNGYILLSGCCPPR